MPELPDVEAARARLHRAALHQRIEDVKVLEDPLVFDRNSPKELHRRLQGRLIVDTGRRGKHFWVILDKRPWPTFHFGMSGWMDVSPGEARPLHWKMQWRLSNGTYLTWSDPRRFGRIRLVQDPLQEKNLAALGFDALVDLPAPRQFQKLLQSRKRNLKALLLDQSFSAGVGNWIADDVLYHAQLSPRRLTTSLSSQDCARLRHSLKRIIQKAVAVDSVSEKFPKGWLYHYRWNHKLEPLPNGKTLVRETIAGRTTVWVPELQA